MGTRALVACTEKLLLADLTEHQVEVVEEGAGPYYGISWTHDGQELCLTHGGIPGAVPVTLEEYARSEVGWISVGERKTEPFLSLPHQLLCVDERYMIATNTGRNCLAMVRIDDLFRRHYALTPPLWDRVSLEDTPGAHLNSVYRHGDFLNVVAHNWKRPSQVHVLAWPSLAPVETISLPCYCAHNVWHEERHGLCVCDSMNGRMVAARSGNTLWQASGTHCFLRGVARSRDRIWVGGSAVASREFRFSSSIIYVLDPITWELMDKIDVPCSSPIQEIRLIDEPDWAHHGVPLKSSISTNHEATARMEKAAQEASTRVEKLHGWTMQCGELTSASGDEVQLIDDAFALVTKDDSHALDVRLEARLTVSKVATRHIDLVARYRGPQDLRMVCGLVYRDPEGLRISIWREDGHGWKMLGSTTVVCSDEHLSFAFSARGTELSAFINGRQVLTARDDGEIRPGLAGVRGLGGGIRNWRAEKIPIAQ